MNCCEVEECTEVCERSLRRRAENKGCCLRKEGCNYALIQFGDPIVTDLSGDECWDLLEDI